MIGGVAFLDDKAVALSEEQMLTVADYLLYDNPSKQALRETFALAGQNRHPRVMINQTDLERILHNTANNATAKKWKELENAANFADWNAMRHFLDPSEMGAAFAIGYDWMYPQWSAKQKALMEEAMFKHFLDYSRKIYYNQISDPNSWPKRDNNWNVVCNGGTLMAAVALLDQYPEACADLIDNAMRGLQFMNRGFFPDGAWEEGVG